MLRGLAAAILLLAFPRADAAQQVSVLRITVSLIDAEHKRVAVPRHALLISDNPASAAPRRVVTAADGTASVNLRPGNYTVESDEPLLFQGQAVHWTQTLDIVAGRDAVLELTADNAEFEAAAAAATTAATTAAPPEADASTVLLQWQESVVALWTPINHASGFVIDPKGLIATSQRAIGAATSIEVQLTPTVKVAGSVLVSDAAHDVAIVRVDPSAVSTTRAVPLGCGVARQPPAGGQKIFSIGVPLREERGISRGTVSRVEPHAVASDLILATGSAGGPVFTVDGSLVGITSVADPTDRRVADVQIVRVDEACDAVAAAEKKMTDAAPPAARLPVEPVRQFSTEELDAAVQRRAGSLNPYQLQSADFDIAFIPPIMVYAAHRQLERPAARAGTARNQSPVTRPPAVRSLEDFSNWSEYVEDVPPVLLIRVTPKQVENFWTTVARGAAQTQGIAIPPIKHFKSGFLRMRALCGDTEITPIHPFKLEQRVSETDAIYEGLYVFDPGALGPQCGKVTLVLYSERTPEKADTRVVDAALLQPLWRDLAMITR